MEYGALVIFMSSHASSRLDFPHKFHIHFSGLRTWCSNRVPASDLVAHCNASAHTAGMVKRCLARLCFSKQQRISLACPVQTCPLMGCAMAHKMHSLVLEICMQAPADFCLALRADR